jgi:hypothetical protein
MRRLPRIANLRKRRAVLLDHHAANTTLIRLKPATLMKPRSVSRTLLLITPNISKSLLSNSRSTINSLPLSISNSNTRRSK